MSSPNLEWQQEFPGVFARELARGAELGFPDMDGRELVRVGAGILTIGEELERLYAAVEVMRRVDSFGWSVIESWEVNSFIRSIWFPLRRKQMVYYGPLQQDQRLVIARFLREGVDAFDEWLEEAARKWEWFAREGSVV